MDRSIRRLTPWEEKMMIIEAKHLGHLPMDYPGPTPMYPSSKPAKDIVVQPAVKNFKGIQALPPMDVSCITEVVSPPDREQGYSHTTRTTITLKKEKK